MCHQWKHLYQAHISSRYSQTNAFPSYGKAIFRMVTLLAFIAVAAAIKHADYPCDDTIPLRIYLVEACV